MTNFADKPNSQIIFSAIALAILFAVTFDWSYKETKATRLLLNNWAEKLDRNVTESGVYIQWESDTLPEKDAWGTPLKVRYKNESLAEVLFVESAGKDTIWLTEDDLSVSRMQLNAKGIGEGIKRNSATVAKEATKGVIKGVKEETAKTVATTKENIKKTATSVKDKTFDLIHNAKDKYKKDETEEE